MGDNRKSGNESTFVAFAKSSGIFFVGSSMSKVITLLLIPLYTYMLPAEDYGYYDLSITCITLLTSFLYCDIWSSVMRIMRDNLEGDAPWKVITSGWIIFGGSTAIYYVIAVVASCFVSIPSLWLVLLYGTTNNMHSMFSCIARGWGSNVDFAVSGVLCTLANVGLNLILIFICDVGYEALYVSYVVGFLLQCAYLFVRLQMWQHFVMPTMVQVKELLVYSAPLGINSVSYWLLTSLSRVVVSAVLSLSANGVFAVGSKFGSTIALATTCFTLAWQDIAFTKEVRPASFYSSAVTQYFGFLMAATALLLPAISLCFPVLVGSGYSDAYGIIPSFLWIAVVSAVSTFIGNIFYVYKDTKTISISMVISCLINVVLVVPLTVAMGSQGANASVLIAFVVNIAIRLAILKKKIGLRFEWKQAGLQFCMIAFCSVAYMTGSMLINALSLVVAGVGCLFLYRDKVALLTVSVGSKRFRG